MSKTAQNNPFEELFRKIGEEIARQTKELAVGTVGSVSSTGITVSVEGDTTDTKKYTCSRSERFAAGDRVLVGRESGTWVVICKIGAPGGPAAKTSDMTQAVGIDAAGGLWTLPQTPPYTLQTADTSTLGGIKTAEAYSSAIHTLKTAVNSAGVLYAEAPDAYTLPKATTATLGGVMGAETYIAATHTQAVTVDSAGKMWTKPGAGAYTLPTADTVNLGGIKTAEAYLSSKHTLKTAVNSSGVLYVEGVSTYTLPTATNATLGGVKPVAKTSGMTQDVGVDSAGRLYTVPGAGAYTLPTADTSTLGGIKTAETYSSGKHTLKTAVNSSGVLYAEEPTKLYAGSGSTYYLELNSSRELVPSSSAQGFDLGNSSYPFADAYIGKSSTYSSYYLAVTNANIVPSTTTTTSGYFDLGSLSKPFARLYVKELYINGTKFTPT